MNKIERRVKNKKTMAMNYFMGGNDRDPKRTLGIRDKQILWLRANKRCENPKCNRQIEFTEMLPGHKTAHARGGKTTLKNAVCLCYQCNKLQGTDSWAVFLSKQGIVDSKQEERKANKQSLGKLSVKELKALADKHHIKVKGEVVENIFDSHVKPPTKSQYITKLSRVVTTKDLILNDSETSEPIKKRGIEMATVKCGYCQGAGQTIRGTCNVCHGKGWVIL